METDIVLATVNARYIHTSLALRSIAANLRELSKRATIVEFTLDDRPEDIAEQILEFCPAVVGLSVYIWNVARLEEVAELLKILSPQTTLVLGGPEVSFETDRQAICACADYVVCGEGEAAFRQLCLDLLTADRPKEKIIAAPPVELNELELPYEFYDAEDIAQRTIYVEMSRGCSHGCEFCLSSLDRRVRRFPPEKCLSALESLWQRGAKRFKFIDRSAHFGAVPELFDFLLARAEDGLFAHFELIPDRLSEVVFEYLKQFPVGSIQIEAGVQTLNREVAARIARRHDVERTLVNLRRLAEQTGVHLHADLVVGLPGEDLRSFAEGFDRLLDVGPQEIQVGILKRLRGTRIGRHDVDYQMLYNPRPPYDILQNDLLDFKLLKRLKRFARYFDLVHNSGRFASTKSLIWSGKSPFYEFMAFSDWLYEQTGQTSSIALTRLTDLVFEYVTEHCGVAPAQAVAFLSADRPHQKRACLSAKIRRFATSSQNSGQAAAKSNLPPRQRRHAQVSGRHPASGRTRG